LEQAFHIKIIQYATNLTAWCSKTQWFAPENCLPDGTPKLGPFPDNGDYEIAGGPVERVPGKQELYDFISRYYQQLESRKGSVESRIREAVRRLSTSAGDEKRRYECLPMNMCATNALT
jgi:hypothetical protein